MAEGFLALDLMNLERRARLGERREERRNFRDAQDPFDLSEEEFISLYRINQDMVNELTEIIGPSLQRERPYGLSVEKQVLTALRFYAVGCYQTPVGNQEGILFSQPSVSRPLHAVTDAINNLLLRRMVHFPSTPNERHAAKTKFSSAAQPFEGTIGAIDCTHISIRGPSTHEEAYLNRYGYHSLNVQAICDPDYKILNINARFPGARHDGYIWANSPVRRAMERNYGNGERYTWLIGDDGYPLEPWLMTPIPRQPEGTPSFRYTQALCQARSTVERMFGVLKATFRCLSSQRVLMYEPAFAGRIVNACAVLHNFRITNNLDNIVAEHQPLVPPENMVAEVEEEVPLRSHALARRVQERLIAQIFT